MSYTISNIIHCDHRKLTHLENEVATQANTILFATVISTYLYISLYVGVIVTLNYFYIYPNVFFNNKERKYERDKKIDR